MAMMHVYVYVWDLGLHGVPRTYGPFLRLSTIIKQITVLESSISYPWTNPKG